MSKKYRYITDRQANLLRRLGHPNPWNLPFEQADPLIKEYLAKNEAKKFNGRAVRETLSDDQKRHGTFARPILKSFKPPEE